MSKTEDTRFQEMEDRIERFLRGEMTMEEEACFREELKTNTELREHARAVSVLLKGLQEQGRQHDQEIIDEVAATKRLSNIRRLALWAVSIAAALVLYLGYSYHAENVRIARVNEMLSPYYMYYDTDNLSRGDVDSIAIARLYALFNRIPEEKDMSEIIAELEPIYESLYSDYTYNPYANDIAWNLALAYIKDDQIDKAIPLLERLYRDNPDTPMSSKAQELLKKLRDL